MFRVALAQVNLCVGDLEGNKRKIIEYIHRARDGQSDLVAFPELSITGYPPEDLLLQPSFVRDSQEALAAIVRETKGIIAVVGFPYAEAHDGSTLYNAAVIARDGSLVSVYRKMLLPNYGVFDEKRYFTAGHSPTTYEIGRLRFAVNICEDIWRPEVSSEQATRGGAHVIVNISSSPYRVGKGVERQSMLSDRARENNAAVCLVNLVGGQDELVFDGESLVFSSGGNLLARAPQFEEALLVADIDVDEIARTRQAGRGGATRDSTRETTGQEAEALTAATVKLGDWKEPVPREPIKSTITRRLNHVEEIHRALVLGTRDYVRKNGFEKVAIGLSGGIDSALVAVIAADALGRENVIGVMMPSGFTSAQSVNDAEDLARRLGIKTVTIPIEEIFCAYLSTLKTAFEGRSQDITEENVQARIRGNVLMALSNKFGWLVLTTGNKSEIAVGYSTLYGDTAGGFAVVKDVPKTLIYELARFRNSLPAGPVIPESILTKAPSAELRTDQKDTDSLPAYSVLDPIIEAYVEQDKSRDEIVNQGFDENVVDRVISMVEKSEYKRRQAPPGVKITPKAFGRDRRMPITNFYNMTRKKR
ncbi:MAG: NAD+ synthase [Candidatus Eisenbacteria bacterium]|nr:NAD+ synthase [Candidatus Eisenbacteria bacterium]